jgi:hypothetical protein
MFYKWKALVDKLAKLLIFGFIKMIKGSKQRIWLYSFAFAFLLFRIWYYSFPSGIGCTSNNVIDKLFRVQFPLKTEK